MDHSASVGGGQTSRELRSSSPAVFAWFIVVSIQISPDLRARHGYPEITPALRAKVFGLNAARVYAISADAVKKHTRADAVSRERVAYRERPAPHYLTYGPKTRREFLNLLRWNGGRRD